MHVRRFCSPRQVREAPVKKSLNVGFVYDFAAHGGDSVAEGGHMKSTGLSTNLGKH